MIANFDYTAFADELGFTKVAAREEIADKDYSLSIPLHVKRLQANGNNSDERSLAELWTDWEQEGRVFWQGMDSLVQMLDQIG